MVGLNRIQVKSKFFTILLIATFPCSCKVFKSIPAKGVYVRIINTDSIKTKCYKINRCDFPGLNPGDTTPYQFMKKYSNCYGFTIIADSFYVETGQISDCKSDVDTPKYITIKMRIIDKNQKIHHIGFY